MYFHRMLWFFSTNSVIQAFTPALYPNRPTVICILTRLFSFDCFGNILSHMHNVGRGKDVAAAIPNCPVHIKVRFLINCQTTARNDASLKK